MYSEKVQKIVDEYSKLDIYPSIIDTMGVEYNTKNNIIFHCKSFEDIYKTLNIIPEGNIVIIDNLSSSDNLILLSIPGLKLKF